MPRDSSEDLAAGLSDEEPAFTPSMTVPGLNARSSTEDPGQQSPMGEVDLLQKLLEVLLSFPDRSLAVGAASKALNILRHGQEVRALLTAVLRPSAAGAEHPRMGGCCPAV